MTTAKSKVAGGAAWLALGLGRLEAEQLSFALWSVFDANSTYGPLSGVWINGTNLTAAENDLSNARSAVVGMNAAQFANVYVYTPNPLNASQEYIVVTPEPSTDGFLAIGLAIILFAARRARKTGSQPA